MNRFREGQSYEQAAAERLTAKGWQILERNWRRHHTELDIIALDGKWLVFVEVKYREAKDRDGGPLAAVNAVKQKRIIRTARYYMLTHHLPEDTPVRFDVIGMSPGETVHIRDAFHVS